MNTKLLQKLYDRKIRISVSNLDLPPSLPGFIKEGIKGAVDAAVAPKFDMDLEMMFEMDGKPGRLQVRFFFLWGIGVHRRMESQRHCQTLLFCLLSIGC